MNVSTAEPIPAAPSRATPRSAARLPAALPAVLALFAALLLPFEAGRAEGRPDAAAATPATAGRSALVLFYEPGCTWCARWDEEIGVAYPLTEEGRRAPLRRVDMTAPRPADLAALARPFFSPTFVLVHDGREVGRIAGYPGEHFFWPLLDDLLAKLPPAAAELPTD